MWRLVRRYGTWPSNDLVGNTYREPPEMGKILALSQPLHLGTEVRVKRAQICLAGDCLTNIIEAVRFAMSCLGIRNPNLLLHPEFPSRP